MFKQATAEERNAVLLSGGQSYYSAVLGNICAVSGKRDEARKILNHLEPLGQRTYVPHDDLALVYLGLEEREQALACLQKAYEEREIRMTELKFEPMFDSLRSDPRFQDLVRRMNFPP